MALYHHKPTGAFATIAGPAVGTDADRSSKIGVVWHDQFSTVGSFTRAEFDAEFEPVCPTSGQPNWSSGGVLVRCPLCNKNVKAVDGKVEDHGASPKEDPLAEEPETS